LSAAIAAGREVAGRELRVAVQGELETGLIAILAAGQDDRIAAVETRGLLASCYSPRGYGLPFAYNDENNSKAVRTRKLGGYGSMVPCIPNLLRSADIPHLASLVAPRPLVIAEPRWASGDGVSEDELAKTFAFLRRVYQLHGAADALRISSR
jgi:hypothetical protein